MKVGRAAIAAANKPLPLGVLNGNARDRGFHILTENPGGLMVRDCATIIRPLACVIATTPGIAVIGLSVSHSDCAGFDFFDLFFKGRCARSGPAAAVRSWPDQPCPLPATRRRAP